MSDMWKISQVSTTRRLAGFVIHSAKIDELAEKKRNQLLNREDVKRLVDFDNSIENYDQQEAMTPEQKVDRAKGWLLKTLFKSLPNEAFKMYDWMVREVKQGNITEQNYRHTIDLIQQAAQWQQWVKEYNRREPEFNPNYMSKDFGLPQLEQWVYDMNSKDLGEHDPNAVQWPDSKVVYKFDDGWHVDEVGSGDLAQEGQLMGHCVGGYGRAVDAGDTHIYSLRDPKGQPHVTTEITKNDDDKEWYIVQEQGKGNSTAKDEYRNMMLTFYDDLGQENGVSVAWAKDMEPEDIVRNGAEGHGEDFNVNNRDELENYYDTVSREPNQFKYDEEPEYDYDAYGRPTRTEYAPRGLQVDMNALKDIIVREAREYLENPDDDPADLEQVINQAYIATHHVKQMEEGYGATPESGIEAWNELASALQAEVQHAGHPAQEEALFDTSPWKRTDDDSWRPIIKPVDKVKTHKIIDYLERLGDATPPLLPHNDNDSRQDLTYSQWDRDQVNQGRYYPQPYNKPKPSWWAEQRMRDINGVYHPDVAIHDTKMRAWQPVWDQAEMVRKKKNREDELIKLWGGPPQLTELPKYDWQEAKPTPAAAGMEEDDYKNYFGSWHDKTGALDALRLEAHLKEHGLTKTAGSLLSYYESSLGYSPNVARERAQVDLAFVQ